MNEINVDEVLSLGSTTGKVRIINNFKDLLKVNTGDIIVANFPSPLFNPFMLKAAGLIVEKGGVLSHAAIVAREFGIPCLRIKNARKLLKNKKINLNATKKIVKIL